MPRPRRQSRLRFLHESRLFYRVTCEQVLVQLEHLVEPGTSLAERHIKLVKQAIRHIRTVHRQLQWYSDVLPPDTHQGPDGMLTPFHQKTDSRPP